MLARWYSTSIILLTSRTLSVSDTNASNVVITISATIASNKRRQSILATHLLQSTNISRLCSKVSSPLHHMSIVMSIAMVQLARVSRDVSAAFDSSALSVLISI